MITTNAINTRELKQWIDDKKGFILIDVLPAASYDTHHVPTAVNPDYRSPDFMQKVSALAPNKDAEIVVYCMSFNCTISPAAARRLSQAGYTNIALYDGGLADWQDSGLAFDGTDAQSKVRETCDDCGDCGCN